MDDFISIINKQIKLERDNKFNNSEQLSLGDLINKLKSIPLRDGEDEQYVIFDFGRFQPIYMDSWRGAYDELAINYNKEGDDILLSDFIKMLEECIGKTFTGWKGGEFIMNENTPLWVDNSGESTNTAVIGIIDDGFRIIIETKYIEY